MQSLLLDLLIPLAAPLAYWACWMLTRDEGWVGVKYRRHYSDQQRADACARLRLLAFQERQTTPELFATLVDPQNVYVMS